MLRFGKVSAALVVVIAAVAFAASAAAGGNGSTVLQATLPTGYLFDVNGVVTLYTFTCNESRVQRKDGSATESMNCRLDPGQTPPAKAAHESAGFTWYSDFWLNSVPGFAGPTTTQNVHGVVAPSGAVNFTATFAAP